MTTAVWCCGNFIALARTLLFSDGAVGCRLDHLASPVVERRDHQRGIVGIVEGLARRRGAEVKISGRAKNVRKIFLFMLLPKHLLFPLDIMLIRTKTLQGMSKLLTERNEISHNLGKNSFAVLHVAALNSSAEQFFNRAMASEISLT